MRKRLPVLLCQLQRDCSKVLQGEVLLFSSSAVCGRLGADDIVTKRVGEVMEESADPSSALREGE